MTDATTMIRLEAMLVALRDQLDHLTERVDARLDDQQRQLARLQPREVVLRQPTRDQKPIG